MDRKAAGDFIMVFEFVDALRKGTDVPLGIHEAMDMTLPCIISQQSINQDSKWINVPDTRQW